MSAALIKELRERTGLGLLECKKALSNSNGDIDQAIDHLRKSSGIKAAKKAGRVAADGIVTTKISEDKNYKLIGTELSGTNAFFVHQSVQDYFTDFIDVANHQPARPYIVNGPAHRRD